ncbi:MAG: CBS domain-containing protein [Verrucomicrobiota bacterium]
METPLKELIHHKGSHVCHVEPETTIEEAARLMLQERVGALLVMHEEEVIGILTERDLLNRVLAKGLNPTDTRVHEVMTSQVVVVRSTITVRDAMQIVTEKRFRHLPVVEDGHLLGMLSSGDLTRSIVDEEEGVIHTLMDYIYGTYPA